MPPALLATKLFIPPSRPNWVLRPRLLQKLNDGLRLGCKLTLISAPAGFGKTTLVTAWIAAFINQPLSPRATWLSLGSGDNDLVVFLHYLIAAFQRIQPGAGDTTLHLLENVPLPPVETLLLPLVNDLAYLTEPLILVLDDYHTVQLPVIHEAVAYLIERQLPNLQVVITTRQDPLLPLARWRARGLLMEIRLKELRFTEEEAAEFLNHTMGLDLQAEDVARLGNRTEGWIAGLQLAAVSLYQSNQAGGEGSLSQFVQAFAGNDRYVMDYLIDEVLIRQPEDVQEFLLLTSILDQFNTGLCEALLGDENLVSSARPPESILEYLDRANLFLISLDNHREWYRYHHLFAELLAHRLKLSRGNAYVGELKRRASIWFDRQNLPDQAIYYAQAALDWELSTRLITKYGPDLMRRGEAVTLLRWLRVMPTEMIRSSPALSHIYGYELTVTGKLDLGLVYLKLAEEGFKNDPEQLGSTLAFASYNACFRGDFQEQINLAERALGLLPPDHSWIRGVASVSKGLGLCHIDDTEGCENAMRAAYAAGQESNSVRTCVFSLAYLGRMSVLHLDFEQAEMFFQQAAQYQIDGRTFPSCDLPLFDLALLKYEQNDLDGAMRCVELGFDVNQRSGNIEMRAYGFRQAARLNQLQGQADAAQAYLQKALQLATDYNLSPLTLSLNAACRVEMALAGGNLREAERAAPSIVNSLGLFTFNFYPEMARARLLLVLGKSAEALHLLKPGIERAQQPGWQYPRLQVRLLQALAEADPVKAKQHLREALILAEPAGAVRCFVDLGKPLQSLLLEVRPQLKSSESAYADHLLAVFRKELQLTSPAGGSENAAEPLMEPLTDRELEVLRLLADGLSNTEIASRLYLSPNTLKAHTQNIYSKLDVHSRVQVVNKARALGILPSS